MDELKEWLDNHSSPLSCFDENELDRKKDVENYIEASAQIILDMIEENWPIVKFDGIKCSCSKCNLSLDNRLS